MIDSATYKRLELLANRIVNNSTLAEDILHDALIRCYAAKSEAEIKLLIDEGVFCAYMNRTIYATFIDYTRKNKQSFVELTNEESEAIEYDVERDVIIDATYKNLNELLCSIEQKSKRHWIMVNIFRLYVEHNYNVLALSRTVNLSRSYITKNINELKSILTKELWAEKEKLQG